MKTRFIAAESRGHANHGWLDAHHSFSFANYRDPERMNFGALRVLNDDVIAGGRGFGMHPHHDMEIVTIPLAGTLVHEDSMGNRKPVSAGEVQYMSAGTGVNHSEMNGRESEPVKLFQIWVFPDAQHYSPRYNQIQYSEQDLQNRFHTVVAPEPEAGGQHQSTGVIHLRQQAWFSLASLEPGEHTYTLQGGNGRTGVYLLVIDGQARVGEHSLGRRDALEITDTQAITLTVPTDTPQPTRVLALEVTQDLPQWLFN